MIPLIINWKKTYFEFRTETETNGGSSTLRRHESPFFLNLPISTGMASNMALALMVADDMGVSDQDLFERLPQCKSSTLRGKTLQSEEPSCSVVITQTQLDGGFDSFLHE